MRKKTNPQIRYLIGHLTDSGEILKSDLTVLATEQVSADIGLVQAQERVLQAQADLAKAVARKTKAERALTAARNKLGANTGGDLK